MSIWWLESLKDNKKLLEIWNMTEKAKRIENALDKLGLQNTEDFTIKQLDDIASMANVHRLEVMLYLRCR